MTGLSKWRIGSLGPQHFAVKRCYSRANVRGSAMPFIHVHIAAGRPLEKRRRLAAAITDAVTDILELERGATQVVIHEHDRDNWAIGGELLSERRSARDA